MRTAYEINGFAQEIIKKMEDFIMKNLPEIPGHKLFRIRSKLSYGRRRTRSWGGSRHGRPFISLVMRRYLHNDTMNFLEYDHVERDPVIGGMKNISWRKHLAAVIAHEVAHAYQWTKRQATGTSFDPKTVAPDFRAHHSWKRSSDGHGADWQYVYSLLRSEFVNKMDGYLKPVEKKDEIVFETKPAPATPVHVTRIPYHHVSTPRPVRNGSKTATAMALYQLMKKGEYTRTVLIYKIMEALHVTRSNAQVYIYNIEKKLGVR